MEWRMHARNRYFPIVVFLILTSCSHQLLLKANPVLLDGTWEYYPGLFLSDGEFDTPEAKALLRRVRFFDQFQRSGFKELWSDGYGHGTLRYIVDSEASDAVPESPLFMRIPYFDMAVRVMAQGRLLHETGRLGTDAASSNPVSYFPLLVELPPAVDGTTEIVLQFSNYDYPHGGLRDYPVVGDLAAMQRMIEAQLIVEMAIIAALVLLCVILGIIFYFSPADRSSLFLSLLCLSAAAIMLVNGSSQFGRLGMSWDWINRQHYSSSTLNALLLFLFLETQYGRRRDRFGTVVVALAALELAAVWMLPVALYSRMNGIHVFTLLFVFGQGFVRFGIRLKEKEPRIGVQFFALLVLFLFYFGEQFDLLMVNQFNYSSPVGVILFALIQIVITIVRIRKLTSGLEEQVALRTRELTEERDRIEERVHLAIEENREKDDLIILQARQAVMGELFDFIAHQWKQSLYAISLYAGTLRNLIGDRPPEKVTVALDSIDLALRHTVDTITDFRDFMNPRRGTYFFTPREPVEETLAMLADMLSVNRIDVETRLAGTYCISGTASEFKQVLINLIVNAKDAIRRREGVRGKIAISADADDAEVVIRVSDNGGGIPEALLSTVFGKYVTDKADGNGLGLYLSRMIVERRFGGRLLAENGSEGAVFSIILPRVEERRETGREG